MVLFSLIFLVTGGIGPINTTFYERLALLHANKMHQTYNLEGHTR